MATAVWPSQTLAYARNPNQHHHPSRPLALPPDELGPLTTNLADGGLLNFTNVITPAIPKQFFRIRELP